MKLFGKSRHESSVVPSATPTSVSPGAAPAEAVESAEVSVEERSRRLRSAESRAFDAFQLPVPEPRRLRTADHYSRPGTPAQIEFGMVLSQAHFEFTDLIRADVDAAEALITEYTSICETAAGVSDQLTVELATRAELEAFRSLSSQLGTPVAADAMAEAERAAGDVDARATELTGLLQALMGQLTGFRGKVAESLAVARERELLSDVAKFKVRRAASSGRGVID